MITSDSIGVFEAKTKFSEICERVATTGESVTVTRRGKPLVTISPVEIPVETEKRETIWESRARFEKEHGSFDDEPDFELPQWPDEYRIRMKDPLSD